MIPIARSLWKFFTSLRLTVVTLVLSIVLVFIGTVAQADEGLYQAQERYFKQWFLFGISLWGYRIPIPFPGGYLLGTVLLVNLVAAHLKQSVLRRYRPAETFLHHGVIFLLVWGATTVMLDAPITGFLLFTGLMLADLGICGSTALRDSETARRLGLNFTHFGVVALLAGQLATDMLSRESLMSFREGEMRSYSEDHRDSELVFLSDAGNGQDEVIAIPEHFIGAKGAELTHPKLPFTVRVKDYAANSELRRRAPAMDKGEPPASNGVGPQVTVTALPVTREMDKRNVPFAVIEIVPKTGPSLGTWLVSPWLDLNGIPPQEIAAEGRTFRASFRLERNYHPFSVTLLKTTHEKYPGTNIPKNYQSRVRVENPAKGETREVDIYMNNPLRYGGLTFFQSQMDRDTMPGFSGLQVVRNPSWFTPYLGCSMVAYGMLRHFLVHLIVFLKKRKTTA
jgi:hypothetical protein